MGKPFDNQNGKINSFMATIASLIFNGKMFHLLNPWHIEVDTNQETITIRKGNPFLIGFDEQIVSFRYIRSII